MPVNYPKESIQHSGNLHAQKAGHERCLKRSTKERRVIGYWNWRIAVGWTEIRRHEMTPEYFILLMSGPCLSSCLKFTSDEGRLAGQVCRRQMNREAFNSVHLFVWMNEWIWYGLLVGCYWKVETEVLEEKPVTVPLCPSRIPLLKTLGAELWIGGEKSSTNHVGCRMASKPWILKPVNRSAVLKSWHLSIHTDLECTYWPWNAHTSGYVVCGFECKVSP
jgi:hypothetical protein